MTEITKNRPEGRKKTGWLGRLGNKLGATRQSLGRGLNNLLLGKRELDDALLEDLEDILLTADIGVQVTQEIIAAVTDKIARKQLSDAAAVVALVQQQLLDLLAPVAKPLAITRQDTPYVIMVVGVNGVGKTTTIGKMAHQLKQKGYQIMLAAGDTFRAAAVEQLQQWGKRSDVPVIAQPTGSDSASVAHDAMQAASAKHADVLIIDTAGRQHTKSDLMQELEKIKRVIAKLDASAPHEVLLVLDAGTGQNALSQLEHFNKAVHITGLCLTKLDGTAKGGIIVAIAKKTGLPIRYIGVGEDVTDLRPFDAEEFNHALFDQPENMNN
jgi:fused signal recognition particle receptor